MIRALARRALERYGYEVLEAEDGEAVQELMRSDVGLRVELVERAGAAPAPGAASR
jgi:CheY-like chemotaxis protein